MSENTLSADFHTCVLRGIQTQNSPIVIQVPSDNQLEDFINSNSIHFSDCSDVLIDDKLKEKILERKVVEDNLQDDGPDIMKSDINSDLMHPKKIIFFNVMNKKSSLVFFLLKQDF
ncbi:Hypothetical protein CINCED_3A025807 [Cinara cedri]|uniref:Uncharacterized protein n=1 Tax=Cinara cedri TaxID=506608 RepID=A0A5E4MIG2_9HEMI|nr:Hypothetical protein CINCED_3A025807 [Cinara cedri]